jgi:putative ABC transport system permease protein
MPFGDLWGLVIETLRAQRMRSVLTVLGIVIGVASVVLLASIGQGARTGIAAQFSQFGTTVLGVRPGRVETFGMSPGVVGGTTRPLSVEDAHALRRIPGVLHVAPHVAGLGEVEAGPRTRRCQVYGTTADDRHILRWPPRVGSFLPDGDVESVPPVCALGSKVAKELFPAGDALGARLRIGTWKFSVVGIMESKGQMLGFDLDDMVFVPLRFAMKMFNLSQLQEIHVYVSSHERIAPVTTEIERILRDRHGGEDDVTITSQADLLKTIDEVLRVVSTGVLLIAAISVLVGAIGILTIEWVAVSERTPEIGLLKALGASDRQVLLIFLAEAAALAGLGGVIGLLLGTGGGLLLTAAVPAIRVETPAWIPPVALAVSLGVGLAAGVLPARRAARLDPIQALRAE